MRVHPAAALALALALAVPAPAALPEDAPAAPPAVASHTLGVTLDPDAGRLEAADRMEVRRNGGGELAFELRSGLEVRRLEVDGRIQEALTREEQERRPGVSGYRVRIPRGPGETATVSIAWGGVLREDVAKAKDLAFVVGDSSRGTISPEGVFLSDGTAWVPHDGSMATWAVSAAVPEGWTVVTQGGVPEVRTGGGRTTFTSAAGIPADGLWLQAGRWKAERRTLKGGVVAGTFLSEANAGLSKLILDSVEEYMGQYAKVLGPYPHAKFDVVENFFSTGYGMPSATLLGGDVVQHMGVMAARAGGRIPPGYVDHELVHCWWGNGVFVDYSRGNWCEGLTSYCSNYLRKEWESAEEAAKHRRGTRARFAARVRPERDYPVRRFTGKTEDFENDIGYGKASMVFHAARRAAGEEAFWEGLRDFARAFTGKRASWEDIRACLERRSGRNLKALFDQALDRTGAPVLVLEGCAAAAAGDGWQVTGVVRQVEAPWWALSVPLAVETVRGTETTTLDVSARETAFSIRVRDLPVRVLLDPASECWRGYLPEEAPAMLDATLQGPGGVLCVLPAGEGAAPFAPVVEALRARKDVDFAGGAGEPGTPPGGERNALVLGREGNAGFAALYGDGAGLPFRLTAKGVVAGGQGFEGEDVAVLSSRRLGPGRCVTFYFGMSPAALAAARRVFFYGGDGTVVFKGGRPVLRLEPGGDGSSVSDLLAGPFAEASAARAEALLDGLCAKEVEGRLAGSEEGARAEGMLAETLRADGLAVVRQDVSFDAVDWDGKAACLRSGEAEVPGEGVPFSFSPPVAEWRRPTPLLLGKEPTVEGFLASLHQAIDGGAEGVLVLGPPEPPAALADYLLHPSALPAKEAEGLRGAPPGPAVEGRRARLLPPGFEVKVPVVYLGTEPERSALPTGVRSPVTVRRVAAANLLAVVPGGDPALAGEGVLLGAHHDHLGPGFPGANDNASGVAAVREAARALLAAKGALRRPVVIALFGAEEWGLAGSRAFVARPPEGMPRIVAVLNLDAVGHAGTEEVNVVGESVYPGLAALAARCLAGAGLRKGRDIDRFAFAWGSDHWSFHAAGIPAVDLFSMEYRLMHTPGDARAAASGEKVARVARAAAAWALAVSRDGVK